MEANSVKLFSIFSSVFVYWITSSRVRTYFTRILFRADKVEWSASVFTIEEHKLTKVHQDKHYGDLENGVNNYLSPIMFQNENSRVRSCKSSKFGSFLVFFSSEGNSTKNVHDQVNPKHLDNSEWIMSNSASSKNGDCANCNIYS